MTSRFESKMISRRGLPACGTNPACDTKTVVRGPDPGAKSRMNRQIPQGNTLNNNT